MITSLISLAQELVVSVGYPGIVFVALLENFFPPLPSEVIFPFVGFVAAEGELKLSLVIAAGVFGTFLGALFWYFAGYLLGAANLKALVTRYGKPLGIHWPDVEKAKLWFGRYQIPAIFFGRLVPLVRTFISIPAGFIKMGLIPFSFLTALGSSVWVGVLACAGFALGDRWEAIVPYFERYQLAFELFFLVATVFFVIKRLRLKVRKRQERKTF